MRRRRSFAQQVDGLVKLVAGLGLPDELAWEMVPGATKEWVDRAIEIRDKQREEMEAELEQQPQLATRAEVGTGKPRRRH